MILNRIPKKIFQKLEKVFKIYKNNGYELYLVGGCVRDILLNKKVNDYDLTTNAPFEFTEKMFEKVIPIGKPYGTLKVIFEELELEITRYRKDVETDGRRAIVVSYTDNLLEDLERRDFTINAIAFDIIENELIDPFNGVQDLVSKKLRFVGSFKKRIEEDNLRFLRLIRFYLKYNFSLEENILKKSASIFDPNKLSQERIYTELNKIFEYINKKNTKQVSEVIEILSESKIFSNLVEADFHRKNLIKYIFDLKDFMPLVMAHISSQVSIGKTVNSAFSDLKLEEKYKIKYNIIQYIKIIKTNIGKTLLEKTKGNIKEAREILRILCYFNNKISFDKINEEMKFTLSNKLPYSLNQLSIKGEDLIKLGFEGKNISNKLQEFLELIKSYPELNNKNILISRIQQNI